jgi:acyl carrier protein
MAGGSTGGRDARISGVVQGILARRAKQPPTGVIRDLRGAGLTSLDLVNLMLAIEAEFDIEIPNEQITPENFSSVEAIDQLVAVLAPAA